jgi:CheY-like chemotaxis protein
MQAKKTILAVLDDLMFTVKIKDAAQRSGFPVEFLKSELDAFERAKDGPLMMIIDLNARCVNAVPLIAKLKSDDATKGVTLIGYVSHVQGELKQQAQEAGCDMVLARSAFSQNLPVILKRHAGVR